MYKAAALLTLLSCIVVTVPNFQVQLTNIGNIIESQEIVSMEPQEIAFNWGTLAPGERRDIYHQKVAILVANQQISLTATLDLQSAIHFNIIGIWIQVGPTHYFLSKNTPSETWNVPQGTHDVYYDCTMFAYENITELVSGEMLTRLAFETQIIGTFKIQYTINP